MRPLLRTNFETLRSTGLGDYLDEQEEVQLLLLFRFKNYDNYGQTVEEETEAEV
jgi:hypothetical protein